MSSVLTRISRAEAALPLDRRVALEALRQLAREMTGRKLPGERELAQRLSVSRQQLRVLLDILETEEVVYRRQGSGTYAAEIKNSEISHVGLVLDSRLKLGNDPFFSLVIERLQLCLQAAGIHCVIERTDGTHRPRFLGDGLITLGLSGLDALSYLRPDDPPAISLLAEEQYPHAFPGAVSLLLSEDRGGGFAAAMRAITDGYRHLIYLGRPHLPASRARWEGVQSAATLHQNRPVTSEMIDCGMNYGSGMSMARDLAERFPGSAADPVLLIAANDWLAVGLRAGLIAAGSPLAERTLYSFDGMPITDDPTLNIRSLRFPTSTFVEDALVELKRLRTSHKGRVIRYAMEWTDGWELPAVMPGMK